MAKNQEDWEFGRPPEEIGVSEEISFPDPALEFSAPPPEYTDPAPEIIEPDSAPAESGTHGKQASSRFYMMLLTVVLALMAGWTAQPLDAAARKQNRGHAIEEGLVVTETTYRKKENSEQGGESSVSGEGAESSGSDRSESGEGSQEQSQTSTETVALIEPGCDIVLVGMSSEMIGQIFFSDMDDVVLPVVVEYWDPETETMVYSEEVEDISKPFVLDFTTEHFYDANQAYYDAAGTFPMEAEVRVRMRMRKTLESGQEEEERTFTQRSIPESVQWWAYYDNSTETTPYTYARSFVWQSYLYGQSVTVVYNQPELVTEDSHVISLLVTVDGEPVSENAFTVTDEVTSGDVYTTEGYTHYDEIHDITAVIARDMFDAPSHTAVLYVTQYLEGYDRVVTLQIEYRFETG